MSLTPFLGPQTACEYQLLNKFFYDIAIGRVYTRLTLATGHFFTYWYEGNLSTVVIGYNKVQGVKCHLTGIDMTYWLSCTIDNSTLLQVKDCKTECRTLHISYWKEKHRVFEQKALPSYTGRARKWPSLCKTIQRRVFLIGGHAGSCQ